MIDGFIEHLKKVKMNPESRESMLKKCIWWKEAGIDYVMMPAQEINELEKRLKEEKLSDEGINNIKNCIDFLKESLNEGVAFIVTSDKNRWAGIVTRSADIIFLDNGNILRPRIPYSHKGFSTGALPVDQTIRGFMCLKRLDGVIKSQGEGGECGYEHMLVILEYFKKMGIQRFICLKSEMELLEKFLECHKDKDLTNHLISREHIKGFMDKNIIYLVTEKYVINNKFDDWKAVFEDGRISDMTEVKK